MAQCAQCGQQEGAVTIRRCSACKTIGYCSHDCQKRHWSSHKRHCGKTVLKNKSLQSKDASSQLTVERETKATEKVISGFQDGSSVDVPKAISIPYEGSSVDLPKATGTSYGGNSVDLQKAIGASCDGRRVHVQKAASASDDGSSVDVPLMTCHKCGMRRPKMKKCESCEEVTYCSRDCQRADWKAHKAFCLAVVEVTSEHDAHTMEKEAGESGKPKGATGGVQKELLSSSPVSWEEARSRAAKLYPRHRIVDKFRELQPDWMWVVRKEMVVAVLKIGAVYPHFFRHGRCLEDAEGVLSFVLFHTPEDPRPHFRYEHLREGNFLCYEHAHMHLFNDGNVGLRIDEAKEVRILEPINLSSAAHTLPMIPQQWDQARFEAQTIFPYSEIMDNLQSIDCGFLSYLTVSSVCAPTGMSNSLGPFTMETGEVKVTVLVQLVSPMPCASQHSWVVKDRMGTSAQVRFSFSGVPSPHFRLDDLQVGHFLCVNRPTVTIERELYIILATDPHQAAISGFDLQVLASDSQCDQHTVLPLNNHLQKSVDIDPQIKR